MKPDSLEKTRLTIISRRALIVSAASVALVNPLRVAAQESAPLALERSAEFEEAFAKLVGSATPMTDKIVIALPEIAENGNFVPVTVTVDSPMTDADYVKTIHLLSTSNPVARVAKFTLSPLNGSARVQSRMRLAKTQEVIALAELSSGSLAIATALVKVTIGGCAG